MYKLLVARSIFELAASLHLNDIVHFRFSLDQLLMDPISNKLVLMDVDSCIDCQQDSWKGFTPLSRDRSPEEVEDSTVFSKVL